MIDLVAKHIRLEPGALPDGGNARQNARRDFCRDQHLPVIVKYAHRVALFDVARFRVNGVNPDLLRARLLQHINIAVAGVGAGFIVKAGQLQRIGYSDGIVPAIKPWRIGGQRMNDLIVFQLPGVGDGRQPLGVDFNLP